MRPSVQALAMAGLLLLASPAFPHHSQTFYEDKKQVTLKGVVTKWAWQNPHTWLYVDVTASKDKVEKWAFELNAAASLGRAGWKRTQFKAGDQVTVTGWPMRDGSLKAMLGKVVTPDGKEMSLGDGGPTRTVGRPR